jgi:seryl-tRNA synthetase
MLDIKLVRDNPQALDAGLAKRGLEPLSARLLALDEARRRHIADLQAAQERRNAASKEVGQAKAAGDASRAQALIAEVSRLKNLIPAGEEHVRELDQQLHNLLAGLPNLPAEEVPIGADERSNREVKRYGAPSGLNRPRQHFEIGEAMGLMDFETAAKLSGARFVVLKGALARLERALATFMLDLHTGEFGYTEVSPPLLVRSESMFGTAQLPKFADDQFQTTNGYWLVPTAEVPLTNLARESVLDEAVLPLRFVAWTPCFRSEAGAAGRDTRGMIRQHQFSKVELVSVTTPEQSDEEHQRMLSCAEEVLKRLEIPYRVMLLSSGDMGFSARKTYDIEVWLPGQGAYREISSCSVCGDFQARRMNARYRPDDGKGLRYVHTLNGSGLAVGRTLIAVLENYQAADGTVTLPTALVPYMGGRTRLSAEGLA